MVDGYGDKLSVTKNRNDEIPQGHAVLSEWPPLERVATELNDDVSSQPTNAARRWASTSTVVLGPAGN